MSKENCPYCQGKKCLKLCKNENIKSKKEKKSTIKIDAGDSQSNIDVKKLKKLKKKLKVDLKTQKNIKTKKEIKKRIKLIKKSLKIEREKKEVKLTVAP